MSTSNVSNNFNRPYSIEMPQPYSAPHDDNLPPSYEQIINNNRSLTKVVSNTQEPAMPLPTMPCSHINLHVNQTNQTLTSNSSRITKNIF